MTIRRCILPLLATVLIIAGAGYSQADWSFEGLGTLGGDTSSARALSGDGSVVVGSSRNAEADGRPFRWQGGAMGAIGDATHDQATGVSADGSVVVINGGGRGPFRWEHGLVVELPAGPLTIAMAYDVSADGSVVVGRADTHIFDPPLPKTFVDAAVWGPPDDQGNFVLRILRDLTPLDPQDGHDFAHGISADGSVIVGTAENASGNREAVRWATHSPVPLGTLGGAASGAHDVSADGSVIVGWAERPDGTREPFRWHDGTMVGLGLLPGDWEETVASAVSADGSVVVGHARKSQPEGPSLYHPFIWDQTHGIRSLTGLLTNNGIDLTDWDLDGASDISADGRVIVGNGYHISAGRTEGWIATIPEPSTLTGLLSMGSIAILAYLWRRRRKWATVVRRSGCVGAGNVSGGHPGGASHGHCPSGPEHLRFRPVPFCAVLFCAILAVRSAIGGLDFLAEAACPKDPQPRGLRPGGLL